MQGTVTLLFQALDRRGSQCPSPRPSAGAPSCQQPSQTNMQPDCAVSSLPADGFTPHSHLFPFCPLSGEGEDAQVLPGAPAGPRHHLREPPISHAQRPHQHFQARCLSPLILDLLWSHAALIRKAHFVNNKHFCTFCEYDVVTLNFWTKFWIGLFSLPSGWPERELIRLITKFPHLQQWHFYAESYL